MKPIQLLLKSGCRKCVCISFFIDFVLKSLFCLERSAFCLCGISAPQLWGHAPLVAPVLLFFFSFYSCFDNLKLEGQTCYETCCARCKTFSKPDATVHVVCASANEVFPCGKAGTRGHCIRKNSMLCMGNHQGAFWGVVSWVGMMPNGNSFWVTSNNSIEKPKWNWKRCAFLFHEYFGQAINDLTFQ